jgi:hypothetical protein
MWIKLPSTVWVNSDKIKEIYCDTVEVVNDIVSQRIYFIMDDDAQANKSRFYVEIEPEFFTLEQATDELVRAIAQNRHSRLKLTEKGDIIAL